ncbi:MAG: thiamine-phosphate kinase [Chloracidobacterium sp.]
MHSERDFIRQIQQQARRARPDIQLGIGDDAAVLIPADGRHLVAMSDALVEDVHFRRRYVPAEAIGHKALAVNLSDCAAMGATPRFGLVSLALPPDAQFMAEGILAGLLALADQVNVALVGGDTSASRHGLFIDVCLIGDVPPGRAVRRSGARAGDVVFVSGSLGAAAAALQAFERQRPLPDPDARNRLLFPEPRLALGQYLAEQRLATAMLDLSDGLSVDLARLCEASRVGVSLDALALPIATAAYTVADHPEAARQLALDGGEDYELLFTVPPERADTVAALSEAPAVGGVRLTRIGNITQDLELKLCFAGETQPLPIRGYDHFAGPGDITRETADNGV